MDFAEAHIADLAARCDALLDGFTNHATALEGTMEAVTLLAGRVAEIREEGATEAITLLAGRITEIREEMVEAFTAVAARSNEHTAAVAELVTHANAQRTFNLQANAAYALLTERVEGMDAPKPRRVKLN